MNFLLDTFLPLAEKYGPGIYLDIVQALQKKGYTVAQVEQIFAAVVPYKDLGINPNAPVQPETPAPTPPPVTP